ncbi:MAG: molybdate ABC transporter substrate-binding protein [Actinomycetota bacterium]|nr:molybdate ABC transporter substrate-binding protein [Actinomycetota bacterium]
MGVASIRGRTRSALRWSGALTLVALVAACGTDGSVGVAEQRPGTLSGTVVVSAAASLTDVFDEIGDAFVVEHPGVELRFNVGSSSQLSSQIQDGAPADVVAFADTAPMDALADAGLLGAEPRVFARNELVIVTKPGNPAGITGLADLAGVGVVSLCADTAPCGRFADRALASAGVAVPAGRITRGQDARATLRAVTEGDAVAGIVYVTDARSVADAAARVSIPDEHHVIAAYPIATVATSTAPDASVAFTAFVQSATGQEILRDAGFLAP